jgi:hypothetical protein
MDQHLVGTSLTLYEKAINHLLTFRSTSSPPTSSIFFLLSMERFTDALFQVNEWTNTNECLIPDTGDAYSFVIVANKRSMRQRICSVSSHSKALDFPYGDADGLCHCFPRLRDVCSRLLLKTELPRMDRQSTRTCQQCNKSERLIQQQPWDEYLYLLFNFSIFLSTWRWQQSST